jgi:hypothetical protein
MATVSTRLLRFASEQGQLGTHFLFVLPILIG